jgi:hypothetical protein
MSRLKLPRPTIKRRKVNVLGQQIGQREILSYDLKLQTRKDLKSLGIQIVNIDTTQQLKIGNDPSRVVVDNREGVPVHAFRRKIEVTFGDFLDKELIKAIERNLRAAILKSSTAINILSRSGLGDTGFLSVDAIAGRGAWEWLYVPPDGAKRVVNPMTDIPALPRGATLVYRPKVKFVGLANMIAARMDAGVRGQDLFKAIGKTGGVGFMAEGINAVKRVMPFRNYVIFATFTKRFNTSGDTYRRGGMPCIVVRAARKRKPYRKFK